MDMNEIKEIFFQECEEQLAELESGLLKMNDGDRDPETVNAVFRAVHSIKGGAGAFGLDDLVAFAHVFETTLDCVRSNKLDPGPEVMKVMLKSADVLADLVTASRDGVGVDPGRSSGLVKELEQLANGEMPTSASAPVAAAKPAAKAPAAAAPAPSDDSGFQPIPFTFDDFGGEEQTVVPSTFEVTFKPRRDMYGKGNEAALLLRDLSRLGEMSIHCNTDDLPALDEMDPEAAYFSWKIQITAEKGEEGIRQVFEFAEWDCELEVKLVEAEVKPAGEELPMVPVPFDLSALDEGSEVSDEMDSNVEAAVEAAEIASNVVKAAASAARAEKKESPAAAAAAAAAVAAA
jgi:two-component system, chemotaxis family, sensor kinase CheA